MFMRSAPGRMLPWLAADSAPIDAAQGREATMQPGLGGPGGDIEDDRHLGQRQVEVEVQHHHGPLIDGQATQLSLETIAFGQPHRHVRGLRWFLVGRHVQLDQVPAPFLACHLVAGAHGQAMEPGIPRFGVTDGTHVPPGRDERFLDRVLSTVPIAQDEGRDGIQSADRRSRQDGERVVVARSRPFHELSLHATTGLARRIWSALIPYGPAATQTVPCG